MSAAPKTGRPPRWRSRNAAASRQALLEAAQQLFGQNGFDGTSIREIGERAGVDAALIARYFGSKADLYIAAVAADRMDESQPEEFDDLGPMVEALLARTDRYGPGPIIQALVRSDTADDIRTAVRSRLVRRLVEPLTSALSDRAVDRAGLRAEVAVAALIGVTLARSQGWFDALGAVPRSELVELVTETLSSAPAPRSGPGPRDPEG